MTDPVVKKCSTCTYYAPGSVPARGKCMRYPPVVAATQLSLKISVLPAVDAEHKCGEWVQA